VRQILTDALCRTKPPPTGQLEIADLRQTGLVLRITSNNARSFAYRFRHPHGRKTLRATIGPYPATSLEAARKRAKEMAAQVAGGANPIDARNAEREAAPSRTFEALAARYLKEHAARHKRPRSAEEDRRNLAVHILPRWAKRDFRTIRRADVIEVIESIVSTGKHAAGNRGMTQEKKLADAFGLTFQQVQKYEKSANRMGSSRLQHAASILNVPVAYFFEGGSDGPFESPEVLSPSYIDDFVTTADGLRLMKAFRRVRPSLQRRIVTLVNEISGENGASSAP
jgi:transcriptional regulator with XRE-family HTH domain